MNEHRKRQSSKLPFAVIFLIGLAILLYPQVSRIYYQYESTQEVTAYENQKMKMLPSEVENRLQLAHAYNASLDSGVSEDPYSATEKEQGRAEYARMLEINEQIGHVHIPVIDVDLPIYAGTSDAVLERGVGHLEGTSLPVGGEGTHTVLTAHSGLPTARLFSDLRKVSEGDVIYIHNIGEILAYQVDRIKVVEPTDFSDLLVESSKDEVTLLTCTPIMINSHRLLVRGHRIPYVEEQAIREQSTHYRWQQYAFYVAEALVVLAIFYWLFIRKKKRVKHHGKATK